MKRLLFIGLFLSLFFISCTPQSEPDDPFGTKECKYNADGVLIEEHYTLTDGCIALVKIEPISYTKNTYSEDSKEIIDRERSVTYNETYTYWYDDGKLKEKKYLDFNHHESINTGGFIKLEYSEDSNLSKETYFNPNNDNFVCERAYSYNTDEDTIAIEITHFYNEKVYSKSKFIKTKSGNPVSYTFASNSSTYKREFSNGILIKETEQKSDGSQIIHEYNSDGQLIKKTTINSYSTTVYEWDYNKLGHKVKELVTEDGKEKRTTTWEYDNSEHIIKIINKECFGKDNEKTTISEYDKFGHIIKEQIIYSDGSETTKIWEYDEDGFLIKTYTL